MTNPLQPKRHANLHIYKLPCQTACRRLVAQVSNRLYRRLPVGRVSEKAQRAAGWKPAIQQIGNLRYGLRSSPACGIPGLRE